MNVHPVEYDNRCFADTECDKHGIEGCEACFGKAGNILKVNSKNEISIKKIKDVWTKEEHISNLNKYRLDYEKFKKSCHFGPNQKEIEEWSNKWIEDNL